MTTAQIEIQIIASLVAIACALPGTFLVLRKMALISDAISHSILPGIVIGFLITQDISSPLLIFLASLTGVFTVFLVEFIQKTKLVKEDTAIGLVFPVLFSIGVILIAQMANDVHLDTDAVLLGEIAFAPFHRMIIFDTDVGPKSLWTISIILCITILLLLTFFKELKITTFDPGLATSLGFSPAIIHYGLMSVASITTVGAFDAVGAVLVVALVIAPPATAYLLTTNLKKMLFIASIIGVLAAISGYWLAHSLDASIAGSMTTLLGLIFFVTYLFAPEKGLFAVYLKQRQQKFEVALLTFLIHLKNHAEPEERHVNHLHEHINWSKSQSKKVLDLALKNSFISINKNLITLTAKGHEFTNYTVEFITSNNKSDIENIKEEFFLFRG